MPIRPVGGSMAAAGTLCVLGVAAAFAACGIDESGTLVTNDGSIGQDVILTDVAHDIVVVDNYVAPPCTDSDASLDASCLGVPVPAGWIPVGVQVNVADAGCPSSTDFDMKDYVSAPTVTNGVTCNCAGCGVQGGWDCSGGLKAGPNCGAESTSTNGNPYCWTPAITHISFSGTVTRSGSPTCTGGNQTGTQSAATTPVSACVPTRCQSDFCGLPSAFKRCIMNTSVTDGGCPAPFTSATVAGVGVTTTCDSCTACALQNADAGCTASLSAYVSNNCTGNSVATGQADGVCHDTNPGDPAFNSLKYQATVPVPSCGPTTNTQTGTATLNGALTICCTP